MNETQKTVECCVCGRYRVSLFGRVDYWYEPLNRNPRVSHAYCDPCFEKSMAESAIELAIIDSSQSQPPYRKKA